MNVCEELQVGVEWLWEEVKYFGGALKQRQVGDRVGYGCTCAVVGSALYFSCSEQFPAVLPLELSPSLNPQIRWFIHSLNTYLSSTCQDRPGFSRIRDET